jgi:Protein of unknown function (DUF2630)
VLDEEDAVEDREILDVIQALAVEERRLRQQVSDGTASDEDESRLRVVEDELAEMWRTLREQRAARDAEPDVIAS